MIAALDGRRRPALALAFAACALFAALAFAGSAQAAKVANPGNVTFIFESGNLTIGNEEFEAASSDDPATASGTVTAGGALTINSFDFPDLPPIDGPFGNVNISINVLGTPTGSINPHTGAMNLSVSVRVDADGGGVGSNCHVGPINLNLITGTTNPPPPNGPITGTPYNVTTGFVTVVDNSFSVPGASGCTTFPVNVNNEINSRLGLPSPSGRNTAILTARSSPILQKAIVPAFTANPSTGSAPLAVNFDASNTFHSRPIASYQWDFDNNGSFDQTTNVPTASTTYTTAGTKTIRLRVTDVDGDFQETTRQVIVVLAPDLTISKTHSGDFVSGNPGSYSIGVTNTGSQPATGQISVTDTLPAGFAFNGFTGSGWSCGESSGVVTCTTDEDVAIGGSAAPLTLTTVPANAGTFTNNVTVDVAGDINASNDSAADVTKVLQSGIDLELVKTLDPEDPLLRGRRSTYDLAVTNVGTLPAVDRVRVVDQLPADVSFVSASGGLDWVCSESAGEVRCFSDEDVGPGESLDPIRIRVEVAADAADSITNAATVDVNGDPIDGNDTGTHVGTAEGFAADWSLAKAHTGDFIVGEPGFYRLTARNVGTATAGNPVTVLDQLPAGLTFESAEGEGWSCEASGQDVTCEHAGQVEAGDQLPVLTLRVTVGPQAAGTVTNTAAISSPDDFNTDNDVASDPTAVRGAAPDLAIAKSHAGNFVAGSDGSYSIAVTNVGNDPAHGPTTVTDQLPAGLTFASASGTGWSCGAMGQLVTCTHADAIGAGETRTIALGVHVDRLADDVVNGATVSNAEDPFASNNSATDPTAIDPPPLTATTIRANPILLDWSPLGSPPRPGDPVSATLWTKADREPVPGKRVEFTYKLGDDVREICRDETNADGVARCKVPAKHVVGLLLAIRYRATFAGDLDYARSRDEASLLRISSTRIP